MINFNHSTNDISASSGSVTINGTQLAISFGAGVQTWVGTPSSANLLAAITDETGTGNLVFSTSPTLVTPNLGTPTSGILTNCTSLPISTGISGLATGAAAFLATPTSANLAALVTDETGTGSNVFNTNPSLLTPTSTGAKELKADIAGTALDLTIANYFSKTITANTTFTVTNIPVTGTAISFILDVLNAGAYTVTWWTGVKWAAGTIPTLTSAGRDSLGFYTFDGGTSWIGLVLGKDLK